MSKPRKKLFGPLLPCTLAAGALVTAYSAYLCYKPRLDDWNERKLLASMLRSPGTREREWAASKLMFKGAEVAGPYFAEAARDPKAEVRALGCRSVAASRSDVASKAPILVEASSDPDAGVRLEAALGLGAVARSQWQASRTPSGASPLPTEFRSSGLDALARLLKDPSVDVRAAAIDSIVLFQPDPPRVAKLAGLADDPEQAIRLAASNALMTVNGPGDPTAARSLLGLVAERGVSQHRQAALEALGRAMPEVRERALASIAGLILDEDTTLRLDAIACAKAAGPRASAVLPTLRRAALEPDPELRAIVLEAIVAIEGRDSPDAIATRVEIVSDPSLRLERRMNAISEMQKLGPSTPSRATPSLIRLLADARPTTRIDASQLLAQIIATTPAEVPSPAVAK